MKQKCEIQHKKECQSCLYKEVDIEAIKMVNCPDFDDVSQISNWAKENMQDAVKSGFITGIDNNRLEPNCSATRAEFLTKYYVCFCLKGGKYGKAYF